MRKAELRAVFRALCRDRETPAVHVTHDVGELVGLADRVGILEEGRIVQEGTLRDLRAAPATPFVAAIFRETHLGPVAAGDDRAEYAGSWGRD